MRPPTKVASTTPYLRRQRALVRKGIRLSEVSPDVRDDAKLCAATRLSFPVEITTVLSRNDIKLAVRP